MTDARIRTSAQLIVDAAQTHRRGLLRTALGGSALAATGLGAPGVLAQERVGQVGANDEIGQAVAVDVAGRVRRGARTVAGTLRVDDEAAAAARHRREFDGRRRRAAAEHHVGGAGVDARGAVEA